MKPLRSISRVLVAAGLAALGSHSFAQTDSPYKILNTAQLMGAGRIDYVTADSKNRRLYVPRGNSVLVFDLDTLAPLTPIPGLNGGHGVAVDPVAGHAFSSSRPVIMWDAATLKTIKTIPTQGGPDGIMYEPFTERIYVLSHSEPNITVIDGKDGSIVGTVNIGGGPEQAQSDGAGHVYVDVEDKDSVAVVDARTLKLTATYSLGGKGGGPGGLGLDAKNGILFAFCHQPATAVILSATDGRILDTLPIGNGVDSGGFNPETMEAFSSQGDGTLTIIKEKSPTSFAVEQTVQTMARAKVCTLDTKTGHIILIATDRPAPPSPAPGASPATAAAATPAASPATTGTAPQTADGQGRGPDDRGGRNGGGGFGGPGGPGGRRGGGFGGGPAMLHILVVGR